jgi:hypothetical protein
MTAKEQLDNHFEAILHKKEQALKNKFTDEYLKEINMSQLIYIGQYLNVIKPKSKTRNYKEYLINYLNEFIYSNKKLNPLDIDYAKKEHLEPLLNYLSKYHDFSTNCLILYVYAALGAVIDFFLIIIGLAKHYYYIPVFTILFFLFALKKQRKLKKEGKILYL